MTDNTTTTTAPAATAGDGYVGLALTQKVQGLLLKIPENQRAAATNILAEYGPRLFEMAQDDAWSYLRRLMAGDLDVVSELDAKLSDSDFIAKVKTNTARWDSVAAYNVTREKVKNEILLRTAPIVASVLLALVGL